MTKQTDSLKDLIPTLSLEETRKMLAKGDSGTVRMVARYSPHGEILWDLFRESKGDYEVAWFATANPAFPRESYSEVLESEEWMARYGLATNPAITLEAISSLAKDAQWIIRRAVVLNPQTPEQVIRVLLEDKNTDVAKCAKRVFVHRR